MDKRDLMDRDLMDRDLMDRDLMDRISMHRISMDRHRDLARSQGISRRDFMDRHSGHGG